MKLEVIISLFRKTIASLSCIEKTTTDEKLKNEAIRYLLDLITQYRSIVETNDISNIHLKYTEEDIIDFSYRCIESKESDLVKFGEDIQFGIIEIIKFLNK